MSCPNCNCQFDNSLVNIPPDIHEIHVTVATTAIDRFVDACSHIKVKPLVIELSNDSHVMTSSTFRGTNSKAIRELFRIVDYLHYSGFKVVRKKIETSPTNPCVPSKNADPIKVTDGYFECHFAINLGESEIERLKKWVEEVDLDLHLSKNAFKKTDSGSIQMMTYRMYPYTGGEFPYGLETFLLVIDSIKEEIELGGWSLNKVITEYAWYDSNLELDSRWMQS